jgi:hypothetical protein
MKTFTISFFVLLFSFFIFQVCEGQTINVPGDYLTIQEGIAAASDGDTVLVADGLYYENIDFLGKKPLMVASHFLIDGDTNHINNTIINGSQPDDPNFGSVVMMQTGEDTTSVLCGFTITGGNGTLIAGFFRGGGGVCFLFSGGKLLNNHIENNELNETIRTNGGGVSAGGPVDPLPLIVMRFNRINHNKSISYEDEGDGGGFDIWYNLIMESNEISYNEASGPYRGDGGGGRVIAGFGPVWVFIKNNQIIHNLASSTSDATDLVLSGGLDFWGDCSGVVSGNNISFNEIKVADDKTGYGTGVLVELEGVIAPDFTFENNFVSNNDYTGGSCIGGGICIYTSGGKFYNNIIQNNKATHGGGISLQYNTIDNQAIFINNTITGNEAPDYGGGMHIIFANAVIINTIIWGNSSGLGYSIYRLESNLEVRYSDVEGEDYWPGEGNENVDPGFGNDGYHLSGASMLWNEGIAATVINGITYECPPFDIDGEPRPWAFTDPDIGADETPSGFVSVVESAVGSQRSAVECYPNPTSGIVNFQFTVYNLQSIILKVYNAQGQEVATVLDGRWPGGQVAGWSGDQVVRWDASGLPAGVYYYRLSTIDQRLSTESGKIVKY